MLVRRSYLPVILVGLAMGFAAVPLLWFFPESRIGLTPMTVLIMLLAFGGIGLMGFGHAMDGCETRPEQMTLVRKLVRQALCIAPILALLSQLNLWPFQLMISVILGVRLEEPVRRFFGWIGQK